MFKEQSDWIQKIRQVDPEWRTEFLEHMKPYQLEMFYHVLTSGRVPVGVMVANRHQVERLYQAHLLSGK